MTDTSNRDTTPENDQPENGTVNLGTQNGPDGQGAHPQANPQFFQQAIALCKRAADAGALQEALLWAQQAEQIANVLEPNAARQDVTKSYARIMLEACLQSQERALTTGNILVQHGELAQIIAVTSERLSLTLERADQEPRMVALMAQGFAKQHTLRLRDKIRDRYHIQYQGDKAKELDQMLETLSNIERCATILCGPERPTLPFDRKLAIAQTAVSNARFSLIGFFSSTLSDWTMAEFFCRRAFSLLTERELTDAAQAASGNAELDKALSQMVAAYEALKRRNYRDSKNRLAEAETKLVQALSA